jgi:hypothetical protein
MIEFSKISRPPFDKNLLLQDSSLAFTFSKREAQSLFFNFLSIKGKPKYLTGSVEEDVCKVAEIASLSLAIIPK